MEKTLSTLRKKIRALDEEILKRVAERLSLARKIGELKIKNRQEIEDPAYEEILLKENLELTKNWQIEPTIVEELTKSLIRWAKDEQKKLQK